MIQTASPDAAALPRLAVVIVNYRTPDLVLACLESLADEVRNAPGTRVTVVDNRSGDGSAARIRAGIEGRGWDEWLRVVDSPVNGGFAFGNNLVLREALAGDAAELFWLLNPDTLVRPGAIATLRSFMQARPEAGIAGTGIETPDGQRWPMVFGFPSLLGEIEGALRLGIATRLLSAWVVPRHVPPQLQRADWVSGASMVVRAQMLREIGLLDEGYFLYFEETDLCMRAARAGWQCWYVPQARVMHMEGASTGHSGSKPAVRRTPPYWFESRRRYFVKHHGLVYAMAADLAWLAARLLDRLRCTLQRKPRQDPPHQLLDFIRHSAWRHPSAPGNPALGKV